MSLKNTKSAALVLPKSVTSARISLLGLSSFLLSLYLIRLYNINNYLAAIVAGIALVLPIIILEFIELKTFRRSSTGLDFSIKRNINVKRVVTKLFGLYFTLSLVVVFYWLWPEYRGTYYTPYWLFAKNLTIVIAIGAIPYFAFLDKFLINPQETYFKVGKLVLGQRKKFGTEGLKDHFLGWLVKAFFLPIMYVSLCGNIGYIKDNPFYTIWENIVAQGFFEISVFAGFFNYMNNLIFTIDLVYVFVGYILTLRLFDSHIRSVEPSFLGWYVALQCYKPFWDVLGGRFYAYDNDGLDWIKWFDGNPQLYVVWGCLILIMIGIYSWASVMFGIRFSNLTNRGILTNGPYRFMRHPAYISKNISWWLIAIPFISNAGFLDALKSCLLLLAVNLIYFLRAKTEERHLSADTDYVQYALAINETGLFHRLFKRYTFLRYNPERLQNLGFLKSKSATQ